MKKSKLPLSPHLQIYKPQLTSVLSISHRFAGIFLLLLLPVLLAWILCLALGENAYNSFINFATTKFMKTYFVLVVFSIVYHLLNGVRHIFWDLGYGLNIKISSIFGSIIVLVTLVVTLISILEIFHETNFF
tara:strand:+ start:705 stop:1100 length:396 start_codon:yes stop_codon:yes gene_type:complete